MARKRMLKDAVQDPLVTRPRSASQTRVRKTPAIRRRRKPGRTVLMAAVAAGFIGGWLVGRFLRIV